MERLSDLEVLRRAFQFYLSELHTAQPGRVEQYHASEQMADVRPEVQPGGEELPVLTSIPVIWPRGGDGFLHMPLRRGDTGLLVCCESDIGQWRERNGPGDPGDVGRHELGFAVFIPGLVPMGQNLEVADGATILAGSDLRLGSADADEPALCGNTVLEDLNGVLSKLGTWAAAIDALAGPTGDPMTFLADAITNFALGVGHKSPSVKVEGD